MKTSAFRLITLLFSLIAIISCSDNAETHPTEGVHYKELPVSLTSYQLAPITEVFSLTCGHCRTMESMIPELEKITGEHFGKLHVTFNQGAQISAMLYYSAVMQLEEVPNSSIMEGLFAAIQAPIETTPDARKAAIDKIFHQHQLISPYDLNEAQQNQLMEMITLASEISQKSQINAVPTFIIKGKYQLLTSGHDDINSIATTMRYLLKQPQ
ncbi:thioredoxin domain-containing protein [Vibrio sp. V27_P1S3P104]|uniref:thiol:disulfide interchange protein DsbA/DsbL n=1 Tax=unclassified Vibrio TaxID=2614977 RepID=UPI001372BE4F|nr:MULTISPECIES: thiol:disulfide interchange protein DsbA/DsbL [unclassified Vibrio]NAW68139.1 thioredoxin domain-containing protein [Vibrio sp. V28_P6S34P95]NAX03994.1 thioredoxin domain-containing protein [Vibrio sp. V30_P3S12P165]NAX37538.1 thioredoxin domain-containing protein [Vibrio sp. V27_P1S3P104]NAX41271.1 thioredoxin domain-containing protein [Vibrio sp. V26_P1S5P106]NNN45054.1 thiol:disulfide interchange protein DsbA/DsbL [Vibrio sp. 1-1(7)]